MPSNSKKQTDRPVKPRPDFPLFPHRNGQWCRKVKGVQYYFGKYSTDPKGEAAEERWNREKDDLLAGRKPGRLGDDSAVTVRKILNSFMYENQKRVTAGTLTQRSYNDYKRTFDGLVRVINRNRLVEDLKPDDFSELLVQLSKTRGPVAVGNEVARIRAAFNWALDAGEIAKPVVFGPHFKKPPRRVIRKERKQKGKKIFTAAEVRSFIETADQPLRAMILLGINCGLGNTDVGKLSREHLDLESGWLEFPRPKTGVDRICPLWPETVQAIEEALQQRPTPKDAANRQLVFITKYGNGWAKDTSDNPVSQAFAKVLKAAGYSRKGAGVYWLRHTHQTIGDGALDPVAVSHIMGHADESMSAKYREEIPKERLLSVTNHVRTWLFENPAVTTGSKND